MKSFYHRGKLYIDIDFDSLFIENKVSLGAGDMVLGKHIFYS